MGDEAREENGPAFGELEQLAVNDVVKGHELLLGDALQVQVVDHFDENGTARIIFFG